jgi:hypothetical protein
MPKPKQWALTAQTEKFLTYRYEAPQGSESALWVELHWSIKRELYTSWRSNAVEDEGNWNVFARPIKHHAVAKRQAFEAIAWATVPQADVHEVEETPS